MKALSIKQPYAGLIIAGIKNIENRSWQTKYSGQLVIVSTKSPDAKQWWEPMREKCKRLGVEFPEELCAINGAALGTVELTNTIQDGAWAVNARTGHIVRSAISSWWIQDMVGFILEHPRRLHTPIHVTGSLGLYNLADDVAENIEKQLQIFYPA
jgi:hypothetical protein